MPASLRRFVADNNDDDSDCRPVPTDPIPAEVRRQLPELIAYYEAALQPASADEVAPFLARLSLHYWSPDRPVEHTTLVAEDYIDDLLDDSYPTCVVAEACREWRRTQKWWPRISELLPLCERYHERYRRELTRLRFLGWCATNLDGSYPRLVILAITGCRGDKIKYLVLEEMIPLAEDLARFLAGGRRAVMSNAQWLPPPGLPPERQRELGWDPDFVAAVDYETVKTRKVRISEGVDRRTKGGSSDWAEASTRKAGG